MTVYVAVAIGVALILTVLAPFFVGPGGLLAAGASVSSPERLRAMKAALLQRFISDEAAHKAGSLSDLAWSKRRAFLVNRYVDCARRLDYLESVDRAGAAESSPAAIEAGVAGEGAR